MRTAMMLAAGWAAVAAGQIRVEMVPGRAGFARFENEAHAGNRIGYRFHEHTPMVEGVAPKGVAADGGRAERLVKEFEGRRGVLKYEVEIREKEWIDQKWTFYLAPVSDGIEMLWRVEAGAAGLPAYYGVQQCFRMSGATNGAWRQEIARTPAFSEFDWWKELGREVSLTRVLRRGAWAELPGGKETVGARTRLGVEVDGRRTGGDLAAMPKVGPYEARMVEAVDDGLIARVSRDGEWVSGIYWERTSHVTDHHPADCLHSIVNVGDVAAGGVRVLRGKIWWFRGGLGEMLAKWRREFRD